VRGASTRPDPVRWVAGIAVVAASLGACADGSGPTSGASGPPATTAATATTASTAPGDHPAPHEPPGTDMRVDDRAAALRATAAFQDVAVAEAAGYASSLEALGCFEDATAGGMGVHLIDDSLLDATLDIAHPEALVYELDGDGEIDGLVAHEYIVPVEAWTAASPPRLFGVDLHRHPTLPLWVLHTWIWKDNVDGVFADWNPAVRRCPTGVPIFGDDRPT